MTTFFAVPKPTGIMEIDLSTSVIVGIEDGDMSSYLKLLLADPADLPFRDDDFH